MLKQKGKLRYLQFVGTVPVFAALFLPIWTIGIGSERVYITFILIIIGFIFLIAGPFLDRKRLRDKNQYPDGDAQDNT